MKSILNILLIILSSSSLILAQENIFLKRSYWKSNPSIENVKKFISEGNDPSELNRYAFDSVVYALLEKTNDDTINYLLTLEGNGIEKKTHDSRTYIFWAAYKGNIEIMKRLIEKGAKINLRDSHGNTPVTFAAATGQKNTEVYELFEKYGVILGDEVNKNGVNSLLLIAPYLKTENELNYFISKGFDIKSRDPKGNNIFNYAVKSGNISFLKLLLKKGISPNIINIEGGNAVLYASKGLRNFQNPIETYKYLKSLGLAINVTGDNGQNPLHTIAKKNNDLDIFSFFMKEGVDINLQDNEGVSPFMNAANSNELRVVKFLIDHVKNVNTKNKNGQSALSMAVSNNSSKVIDFLLTKGCDIHLKDTKGNTLAFYLVNTFEKSDEKSFEKKLKILINRGLSMNQNQSDGNSLLHIAAKKNNLELLRRLSQFGIDINAVNNSGYTVLHLASMMAKDESIIKYLLNEGADKNIKTEFDETAFTLAQENELLKNKNIEYLK